MTLESLISFVYGIMESAAKTPDKSVSASKAGFKLEDNLCLKLSEFCSKEGLDYVNVYPPRYVLDSEPTFSGETHQLDFVSQYENTYLLGELKRREGKGVTMDQLRCFSAKLMDYGLGAYKTQGTTVFRGMFMAIDTIPDPTALYAIGCGITIVSPYFPPVEYMLLKLSKKSMLRTNLEQLKAEISAPWPSILKLSAQRRDSHQILESYKQYLELWKEEVAGT